MSTPSRKYHHWKMAQRHPIGLDLLLQALAHSEAPVFVPGYGHNVPHMEEQDDAIRNASDEVVGSFGLILGRLDEVFENLSHIQAFCREATVELSSDHLQQLKGLLPFSPSTFDLLARTTDQSSKTEGA